MSAIGLLAGYGIRLATPNDLPLVRWWQRQCLETRFTFTCTARRGHCGDHVAHGDGGRKIVAWN